ncbi:hypothetical protein H8959_018930 [Pygathrix nigripes]
MLEQKAPSTGAGRGSLAPLRLGCWAGPDRGPGLVCERCSPGHGNGGAASPTQMLESQLSHVKNHVLELKAASACGDTFLPSPGSVDPSSSAQVRCLGASLVAVTAGPPGGLQLCRISSCSISSQPGNQTSANWFPTPIPRDPWAAPVPIYPPGLFTARMKQRCKGVWLPK